MEMGQKLVKSKQRSCIRKRPKLLALGVSSNKPGYDKPSFKVSYAELEKVFPYHQVASEKRL